MTAEKEGIKHKWPQTLRDMVDVTTAALVRTGVRQADELAELVVTELARYFGGRQFYIPRGDTIRTALRDRRIYREHNGTNTDDLAVKHRLSRVRIYQILKEQRAIGGEADGNS